MQLKVEDRPFLRCQNLKETQLKAEDSGAGRPGCWEVVMVSKSVELVNLVDWVYFVDGVNRNRNQEGGKLKIKAKIRA